MPDCSPEARADRRQQIRDLRRGLATGVVSVADRGRSVAYANPQWRLQLLQMLEQEEALCDGRQTCRIVYVPMHKGL